MNPEFEAYMKSKNAAVFTPDQPGYDFLQDGEFWICFQNPNDSEDLLVRTSEDVILMFFDQWSQTFANDAQGITDLIEQLESIMDDRTYLWKARIGSHKFVSLVNDDPGVFYGLCKNGFEGEFNGRTFTMNADHIEQSFVFWDPQMMEPVKTFFLN